MTQLEYRVVPINTQIHSEKSSGTCRPAFDDVKVEMNKLDKEGWELFPVQDMSMQDGRGLQLSVSRCTATHAKLIYYDSRC